MTIRARCCNPACSAMRARSFLQDSENKMRDLAHMPVKGRIVQCLLHLQKKFGSNPEGTLNFFPGKQDLAS
jgi:hypothetical protein